MRINSRIEGLEQAQQALARLRDAGAKLRPLMQVIAQDLESSTRLRFQDGRDPSGKPWLPLSAATRFSRARKAAGGRVYTASRRRTTAAFTRAYLGNMQPLLDTGRLRNSITSRYGGDYAEVGTNVVYAPIHQFGGKAGRGVNIPARPFIGMSADDRALVVERLRQHILGGAR